MEPQYEKEGDNLKVITPVEPTVQLISVEQIKKNIAYATDFLNQQQELLAAARSHGLTEE